MRIALLSDIHGNPLALDAVLADLPAPSPAIDQPAPEHPVGFRS